MFFFSKSFRNHSTSFMVSLTVHLAVLLLMSAVWVAGGFNSTLELDGSNLSSNDDFESLSSIAIELPDPLELAPLDPTELTDSSELLAKLEQVPELDWTATESMGDGELSDIGELVGLGTQAVSAKIERSSGSGFFGITPTGNKIVYIIDKSPSMSVGKYQPRYQRAVAEVLASVEELQPDQEFYVYLFCFKCVPMRFSSKSGQFQAPTAENKKRLAKWLRSVRLDAGTDPRESLVAALKLNPSCVFLLSDGEFNGIGFNNGKYRANNTAAELAIRFNKTKCPIHTIGLEDEGSQLEMQTISSQSGGKYQFVPAEN